MHLNRINNLSQKVFMLLGFTLLATFQVQAQGPGDGGPTPNDTPVTEIPIDGGVSLLLAGGAALGLAKLRKKYKK